MLKGDDFESSPMRAESLLVMSGSEKVPSKKEAGGWSGHVIPDTPPPVHLALSYQRSPLHPYPCPEYFPQHCWNAFNGQDWDEMDKIIQT